MNENDGQFVYPIVVWSTVSSYWPICSLIYTDFVIVVSQFQSISQNILQITTKWDKWNFGTDFYVCY
jgi:hypothetical protein